MSSVSPTSFLFNNPQTTAAIPFGINELIWLAEKAHKAWTWGFNWNRINSSSTNTYLYFYGVTAEKLGLTKSIPIQWLVQLAFVADTQIRTEKQWRVVAKTWQEWVQTLFFIEPLPLYSVKPFAPHQKIWRHITSYFLDPTTEDWLEYQCQALNARVSELFFLTIQFVIECYIFINFILMLYESLAWDEAEDAGPVHMMFLNWQSVLAELSENGPLLREKLIAMENTFRSYFHLDIGLLIRACETSLDTAAFVKSTLDSNLVKNAFSVSAIFSAYSTSYFKNMFLDGCWWIFGRVPANLASEMAPKPTFGDFSYQNLNAYDNYWRDPKKRRTYTVLPI